jgi:hypothetical protein
VLETKTKLRPKEDLKEKGWRSRRCSVDFLLPIGVQRCSKTAVFRVKNELRMLWLLDGVGPSHARRAIGHLQAPGTISRAGFNLIRRPAAELSFAWY